MTRRRSPEQGLSGEASGVRAGAYRRPRGWAAGGCFVDLRDEHVADWTASNRMGPGDFTDGVGAPEGRNPNGMDKKENPNDCEPRLRT
jgi:hypothetical protein